MVIAEGNNIFEVTETHIRGRMPPYLLVARGLKTFKSHVPAKIGTMVTIGIAHCQYYLEQSYATDLVYSKNTYF